MYPTSPDCVNFSTRAHVATSRIMGFIVTSVPAVLKMDVLLHILRLSVL